MLGPQAGHCGSRMRSGLCLVGVAWKVEPRMGLRQLCHTPPDADPLCGALRLDGGGCGTFSSTCGLISLIRLGSQRRARRASAHRKSRGGQFCPLPGRAQSWGSWPRRSAADKCNDDKKASDEEPRLWCDSWVPNRHIGREQCNQLFSVKLHVRVVSNSHGRENGEGIVQSDVVGMHQQSAP
jgi:hypothetical protein